MFEITPEIRVVYKRCSSIHSSRGIDNIMADALRDAVAWGLKAEWAKDHPHDVVNWVEWQRLAHKRLMGESKMMKDKEVGELWAIDHSRLSDPCNGEHNGIWSRRCCALIRKLVEERAGDGHYLAKALRDFGIPPETWK